MITRATSFYSDYLWPLGTIQHSHYHESEKSQSLSGYIYTAGPPDILTKMSDRLEMERIENE